MSDIETKGKDETIERPAKAWRNWWKVNVPCIDQYGIEHNPGDVVPSLDVYPSRDVAEMKASENMEWELEENGFCSAEYLGALPEGVRP